MAIEDDASAIFKQFQGGIDTLTAFLVLFEFIDGSSTGRFGWLQLGHGEIYGAECDLHVRLWRDRLRQSIDDGSPIPGVLELANVGVALRAVIDDHHIAPAHSKQFVIALRVLDASFRGVHSADVSMTNDFPGLVRLRTNLRKGQPLFGHGSLSVYPKPMRLFSPECRGQSSLSELLDVLTVVHPTPHLRLDHYTVPYVGEPGADGFRNIGIVPAIRNSSELVWKRESNDRYSVWELPQTEAIHVRIREALDLLLHMGADLVLLPELVAGPELVGMLSTYLAQRSSARLPTPLLLLAGTQMVSDGDGPRRNRAIILDGAGTEVWSQDKMHAYCFTAAAQGETGHPLGVDELVDRHEDIAVEPRVLVVVDLSPSQRLVVLTCEDFIQEQPHRSMVVDICATTLLVPIMAPKRGEPPSQGWITDAAMNYVRRPGATSVVANSGALILGGEEAMQAWQFAEIRSSPRLTSVWEPVMSPTGGPPVAWLARLDRRV